MDNADNAIVLVDYHVVERCSRDRVRKGGECVRNREIRGGVEALARSKDGIQV
jgi:hypothetical protein